MLDNGPPLSPWDVCLMGLFSLVRFCPWDVLSLGTCCPLGRFVLGRLVCASINKHQSSLKHIKIGLVHHPVTFISKLKK